MLIRVYSLSENPVQRLYVRTLAEIKEATLDRHVDSELVAYRVVHRQFKVDHDSCRGYDNAQKDATLGDCLQHITVVPLGFPRKEGV